jgi:hypothetical protein
MVDGEIVERFLKEARPHLAPGGTVYLMRLVLDTNILISALF